MAIEAARKEPRVLASFKGREKKKKKKELILPCLHYPPLCQSDLSSRGAAAKAQPKRKGKESKKRSPQPSAPEAYLVFAWSLLVGP